jgi:hypothetical protein
MFEKFQFRRFQPSEEVALYANAMLSQIMEIAPADATCFATMAKASAKSGESYIGRLEVASSEGQFKAEARAQDPYQCIDILDDRIRHKIKEWKNSRKLRFHDADWFLPESPPNYRQSAGR